MLLTKLELERRLGKLREDKTESSSIDAKANLPLTSTGDKARFIRHIVALANTGKPSYLLIGVEDKTWAIVGIPENSPLFDADATQQQMNQILMGRVDPSLAVRYRTYKLSGGVIGVVAAHGTAVPYVIAIEDAQYGGTRDEGKPEYVQRGVIYIRQGADSIIANRQSQIASLVNTNPPTFLLGSIYVVGIGILLNALLGLAISLFGRQITPSLGALIGMLAGLIVGGILTKNLSETMGERLKEATVKKYTRFLWGILFCVLNGVYVGYQLVEMVHQGESSALSSPLLSVILMGIVGGILIGPLAASYATILLNAFGLLTEFLINKQRLGWRARSSREI